jgi:hypothetical protein
MPLPTTAIDAYRKPDDLPTLDRRSDFGPVWRVRV